ncbi:MAG: hypothetical protein V4587_13800, partial [Acidobacteriota bacterium]
SDYNFDGERVYHRATWPCCSGTLPQVAADYRIQAYFHDDSNIFVNLYIPSTLNWSRSGGNLSLTQTSNWPYDPNISFVVHTASPTQMALHFRIPAWTHGASLTVNGTRWTQELTPGQFAAVTRTWKDGDRVELELPLVSRLEAIDPRHPNTVAILRGPLVLFALKSLQTSPMPSFRRNALLSMQRISQREWQITGDQMKYRLVPFTEVGAEPYTTYLQTS